MGDIVENYYFKNNQNISYIKENKIFSFDELNFNDVSKKYGIKKLDHGNTATKITTNRNSYTVYSRRCLHETSNQTKSILISEYFDVVIFSKNSSLHDIDDLWKKSIDNKYLDFLRDKNIKIGFNSIFHRIHNFDIKIINSGIKLLQENQYAIYDKKSKLFVKPGTIQDKFEYGKLLPVTNLVDLSKIDDIGFVFGSESSADITNRNLSFHGGKGINRISAQLSAYGEAVERYSASTIEKIIRTTTNDLNKNNAVYLDPKYLSNIKLDPTQTIEWVVGQDINSKDDILIPANAVLFPYTKENDLEFMPQTTTGLASGITLNEALEHAILEVLERNSYSLVHKSLLPVTDIEIDFEKMNDEILNIINKLTKRNIKIEATLLPENNNVFIVHIVLVSSTYPMFTHGSGAGLDFTTAFKRALTEAVQMRTSQLLIKSQNQMNTSPDNNVAYQWGIGNTNLVAPFRHGITHTKISYSDLFESKSTSLSNILDDLNKKNFRTYYVDLTKNETKLHVVKVIIPGMQDIDPYKKMVTDRLLELGFVNPNPMYS